MNVKDLLQMNDQMLAFNALIKGDLAKEVKEAKEALSALGAAKDIEKNKEALANEKLVFEDHKVVVEEILAETKEALKQEQENVNKAFADLQVEKEGLSKLKTDFATDSNTFLNYKAGIERELEKGQIDLAVAVAKVTKDQVNLDKAFADIAIKETAITAKIAAMKAVL